ncbi:hypothetical protein TIFTF001_043312 [Ficus carica]|uniref:Retrotransposon gag domain-containing protein n=1 Tax=Ficus carica TaxID=3494 RepID=A0AA88CLW7_FICCA|nr:hypothetical protein TIFTF001_043312 [Ficus carica]
MAALEDDTSDAFEGLHYPAPKVSVVVEPLTVPPAPTVQTPKELYVNFQRMKASGIQGSTNLIEAKNWLDDLQDVSLITWEDFVGEFKEKYFNTEIMEAQQDEFNSFCQGNLSIAQAIKIPYPPITVAKCVSRAIRAEYWIGQDKEQWAKFFKAKKEDKAQAK